jgi:transposase InsO family protein
MILSLEKLRKDHKIYRKKDEEIAARIDILLSYSKFELKYSGPILQETKVKYITAFLTSMKISERTILRWKQDYRERGPDGLGKSKATGRPPVAIRPRIRRVIEGYRKMFRWGSEVIQAHLKYDHNYDVSKHKIEKFLDNSGLRNAYPCTTKKRQKAEKKNKHTKIVVVDHPGDHTMIDVKYQTHLLGCKKKCYVYNFIDHASNWSFKFPYSRYSAANTVDFMKKVIEECPFKIRRLQSDNGVEFTYKYTSVCSDEPKEHPLDTFCEQHDIVHKLVPPGEKELQGLVERSHRQDDQELFSRINPDVLSEFEELLAEFVIDRNKKRRFKKLKWMTPNQWLDNYIISSLLAVLLYHPQENDVSHFSRKKAKLISREEEKISNTKNKQISTKEKCKNDVSIDKLAA